MKRFFVLFLAVLVCLSLCINIAFASDVVTARVDQNILVYFPWFGGVSGSSANRVTNYATVTTSDVSTDSGVTVSNITYSTYTGTTGGITYTNSGGIFYYSGTSTSDATGYAAAFNPISGHKYLIDTFYTGNFEGFILGGQTYFNTIFTAPGNSRVGLVTSFLNGQHYDYSVGWFVVDLTDIFGAGSEPATVDSARSAIGTVLGSYEFFSGSRTFSLSQFSLVPAPAANGGSSTHQTNDYTWYQYEADISLTGTGIINQGISNIMYDDTYSYYLGWLNGSSVFHIYYGTADSITNYPSANMNFVPYTLGTDVTSYQVNNAYQPEYVGSSVLVFFDPSKISFSLTTGTGYIAVPVNDSSLLRLNGIGMNIGFNDGTTDYLLHLENYFADSDTSFEGTFTIDRIFQMNDNSYFLFNNQVNLGTYDFNVNVKFPSLDKFNAFSGYWMASFNTSWGEIPVRTQVQEVSANSDSLIKIYKLTFDVPFTGQYTKFNIKYIGDNSDFTTIRVDSSVVDPNAYQNGAGPTTINGLSFYLSSMFDKFWGKIRSLFFDQDQTYEQVAQSTVSSELVEGAGEVSDGASTIHEYETENFDSIEQQMDSLDWEIPNDFGSASNPNSALGFISTFFGGIFLALGSKVQVLIVIPLMLGLCLLILGRGSQALGAINKLFR